MIYAVFLVTLCSGFPGESDADFRFMSTCRYDGDWIETEDTWFGLFEEDSTFELRRVEPVVSRSTAPLYEGERPHPFVVELSAEPDWPLIILSSSRRDFSEGEILTAWRGSLLLPPCTSIVLDAPELRSAQLFTTEEGLFLSGEGICQNLSDTYPGDEFSDEYIEIIWAGDLDRDGSVDLMINDVDDGYYRYNWHLFLSSEAGPGSLVELVASFGDVYY